MITRLLLLFLLCGAIPVEAFPVSHSVPPESFLDYHVGTVKELSFEVAYNPRVGKRLAHHFHLSEAAMSQYVNKNLKWETLSRPLRTRVYCIAKTGREFYVLMTLPKGSQVFGMKQTGKPILRLVCGNPLVAKLPPIPKKAIKHRVLPVAEAVKAARAAQAIPAAAAVPTPTIAVAAPALISTVSAGQVLITGAAGTATSGWWGAIPIVGGLFAGLSGGHGGSPQTPVIGIMPHTPTPPGIPNVPPSPMPTPEPSPFTAFAFGGGLLLALRLRRTSTPGGP